MGLVWSGMDIGQLEHRLLAIVEEIEVEARQIVTDVAREVVDDMYRILVNARTRTGEDREASGGGISGRVDTGQMARDIQAALDADLDGSVVLTWGWISNVEDYYIYQEYGTGSRYNGPRSEGDTVGRSRIAGGGGDGVPAMSALQQSYIKGREKLRQRFRDMGLEVN